MNFDLKITNDLKKLFSKNRLDSVLVNLCAEYSRSQIQKFIEQGAVTINGTVILSANQKLNVGDEIKLTIPKPIPATPEPKAIPLQIVYEDDDLIVINKQAGLVVHPAAGHYEDTLVNALLHHCGDSLSGIGGVLRPGIVHRLDKDTSGLMVVAKNDASHQNLSAQFADKENQIERVYEALAWGSFPAKQGNIKTNIARHPRDRKRMAVYEYGCKTGKHAITLYEVLKTYVANSPQAQINHVLFTLKTGRTHQIRVHSQSLNTPLVGDQTYGKLRKAPLKKVWHDEIIHFPRQALHARKLGFTHPKTGKDMHFIASLPQDIEIMLNNIDKSSK